MKGKRWMAVSRINCIEDQFTISTKTWLRGGKVRSNKPWSRCSTKAMLIHVIGVLPWSTWHTYGSAYQRRCWGDDVLIKLNSDTCCTWGYSTSLSELPSNITTLRSDSLLPRCSHVATLALHPTLITHTHT